MLLTDIELIEASSTDISFTHRVVAPGQGKIKVEYGELEIEVGGIPGNYPHHATIVVRATPVITGFRDEVEDYDFQLKISMRMVYLYPKENDVSESFVVQNTWYFSSFIKTYFKIYAEGVLDKTSIRDIKLPFN